MSFAGRTILLFPLLLNEETGGVSATIEVDENRERSGRYSYCWTRDAVFITKAFDELNMKKETEKFYELFCKKTQSKSGMWEQRFYTDGTLAPCWGYQIDETASVIYGIYEHYNTTKEQKFLLDNLKMCENALHFLFKYLENLFGEKEEEDLVKKEIIEKVIEEGRQKDQIYKHDSYDLWEMNEGVHLYSIASIYGALKAMLGIYEQVKGKYENNRLKLEQISKNIAKINDEINNIIKNNTKHIDTLKIKLDLLNPENILDKGYSIVYKDNKIIKDIKDINISDNINIVVKTGKINANVKGVSNNE